MRVVSAIALILRRLRGEGGILLLLFALLTSTAFLFAAAPRIFNRVADDAVRYALATAVPAVRDIWVSATGTVDPGADGGVAGVQAYGKARQADLPASVDRIVSGTYAGITSVRFAVPDTIDFVSLRYEDGLTDATRLVDGRWPVDRGTPLQTVFVGDRTLDDVATQPPVVFEVAISTSAADAIGAHVGDVLHVALDTGDSLVPKTALGIAPTDLQVVGLYEPLDPSPADWLSATGLVQPTFVYGPLGLVAIYTSAYVAAEAYPQLAAGLMPFHYEWRYALDPSRLDADQADAMQPDLRRLALIGASTDNRFLPDASATASLTSVYVKTGLADILSRFAVKRARSESVLSIAALGPIVLAAGASAMLAILLLRRRRNGLLLARGRGASGALLLGAQLTEGLVLAVGASLLGLLAAIAVVAGRDSSLSPILAFAVAGVCLLLLVAPTWRTARSPLIQLERDDPPVIDVQPRRLVFEATIVGAAIVAIILLQQRGLTIGPVGQTVRFDPLLAAVPVLAGLAAGIVLMRIYPLPIRGLSWLAARRRDFVPVVGLRTVARHPAAANLPLLVLMLTAAFGAFASVVDSSISRGQIDASYLQVGSDYRLEQTGVGGLPASFDPTTVPGVTAVAAGAIDRTPTYVSPTNQRATIDLVELDPTGYEAVTSQTAADPGWSPAFLARPPALDVGSPTNPIPAVVATRFVPHISNIGVGDTFTIEVAKRPLTFQLVQRQDAVPGLAETQDFVIAPRDWIQAAIPEAERPRSLMWVRGPSSVAAPLTAAAAAASPVVRITSRMDAYASIHDAPLGSAVADGFRVALIAAVMYLAITLVGAVVMSGAVRTRDLAYLRTLGVSSRQSLGLTAVEHGPPVLLALIPGIILGVAVAMIVEPSLGLTDFVDGQEVGLAIDWTTLFLVVVALSAVAVAAIASGAWLADRAGSASALRIEDS